ncbi:MAG: hypothetical protein AAF514_05640, partial [Verrucomicrobiota bacterium]
VAPTPEPAAPVAPPVEASNPFAPPADDPGANPFLNPEPEAPDLPAPTPGIPPAPSIPPEPAPIEPPVAAPVPANSPNYGGASAPEPVETRPLSPPENEMPLGAPQIPFQNQSGGGPPAVEAEGSVPPAVETNPFMGEGGESAGVAPNAQPDSYREPNYSYEKPSLAKKLLKVASFALILLLAAGVALFFLMPEKLKAVFNRSEQPDESGLVSIPKNAGTQIDPVDLGPDVFDPSPTGSGGNPELSPEESAGRIPGLGSSMDPEEGQTEPVDVSTLLPDDESPFSKDGKVILDGPRSFLETYLSASNWSSLVPMSLGGKDLKSKMASYYKRHPYSPEKILSIDFHHSAKLPSSDYDFFLFQVSTGSNSSSFPMTVEETPSGLRTDWTTYVEFKDNLLKKFISKPVYKPKGQSDQFHVILRRAHYFDDDVKDKDKKWCFRVESPVPGTGFKFVFVPNYTSFGEEMNRVIGWRPSYFPIVELRWNKGDGGTPYIELVNIVKYNWRGHDPDGGEAP